MHPIADLICFLENRRAGRENEKRGLSNHREAMLELKRREVLAMEKLAEQSSPKGASAT